MLVNGFGKAMIFPSRIGLWGETLCERLQVAADTPICVPVMETWITAHGFHILTSPVLGKNGVAGMEFQLKCKSIFISIICQKSIKTENNPFNR